MESTATLYWGLLFGSIGLGFFLYGKKQKRAVPFICGIGLMIVPYFISSPLILVAAGIVLVAATYFIRV